MDNFFSVLFFFLQKIKYTEYFMGYFGKLCQHENFNTIEHIRGMTLKTALFSSNKTPDFLIHFFESDDGIEPGKKMMDY